MGVDAVAAKPLLISSKLGPDGSCAPTPSLLSAAKILHLIPKWHLKARQLETAGKNRLNI